MSERRISSCQRSKPTPDTHKEGHNVLQFLYGFAETAGVQVSFVKPPVRRAPSLGCIFTQFRAISRSALVLALHGESINQVVIARV